MKKQSSLIKNNREIYLNLSSEFYNIGKELIDASHKVVKSKIKSSGNVGIGTTSPSSRLHVSFGTNENLRVRNGTDFGTGYNGTGIHSITDAGGNNMLVLAGAPIILRDGNVGIGTTEPTEKLVVVGNANITGTLYKGTSAYNNPDIAEMFQSLEELEEGDIAIVDSNNFNKIAKSNAKYQTAIGVVSPNATMVIGDWKGGFSGEKIAMFGRVMVKVSDESGMIKAGDLITTSSTPGTGMKCNSREECNNEILGVAMQEQKQSNDKILMVIKR